MPNSDADKAAPVNEQARDVLPRSASIIEAFTGSVGEWSPQPFVQAIARALAGVHRHQWNAENTSRTPEAPAADVAASKRRIDDLNAHRVFLVEQLDTWAAEEIPCRAEASLHTETLGSVVDRLAIAWVRANKLQQVGNRDRARRGLCQLMELADAYDDLVRDVDAGQRRLPTWRSLKAYGGGDRE